MSTLRLNRCSPEALAALAERAPTLRALEIEDASWFAARDACTIDLSRVTSLRITNCHAAADFSWWDGLTSLSELALSPLTGAALKALARAPWRGQLTDVNFGSDFLSVDREAWRALWGGRALPWRTLHVGGRGWSVRDMLTHGSLPALERLTLADASFEPDGFASLLAGAQLPALAELELRGDDLYESELAAFLAAPRAGMPNLRRLYVTISSGEVDGYIDGWYHLGPVKYIPYSRAEFEERYLRPFGLTATRPT